jgi:hypothetical protein
MRGNQYVPVNIVYYVPEGYPVKTLDCEMLYKDFVEFKELWLRNQRKHSISIKFQDDIIDKTVEMHNIASISAITKPGKDKKK